MGLYSLCDVRTYVVHIHYIYTISSTVHCQHSGAYSGAYLVILSGGELLHHGLILRRAAVHQHDSVHSSLRHIAVYIVEKCMVLVQ